MHLAFDDHRVNHRAEIVDAGIFDEIDTAGVRIDLDFGDVAAVWERPRARSVADMDDVERLRRFGRQIDPAVYLAGQLHDRDRAVGADDGELAALERNIGRRRFEHIAGELLAFLDDFCRAFDDRGAAVHDRFRAAGSTADYDAVAVALHQLDLVEGNAELLGQHLRERRGVTHAEIHRAGGQRHGAVGVEDDAGGFLGRSGGDFKIRG